MILRPSLAGSFLKSAVAAWQKLPAGTPEIDIGDSISAQNNSIGATGHSIQYGTAGYAYQALILDGRTDYLQWSDGTGQLGSTKDTNPKRGSNFGYAGRNANYVCGTGQLDGSTPGATADNIPQLIAGNPNKYPVTLMCGVNASGQVAAQKGMVDALHDAGIPVIWAPSTACAQSFYGSAANRDNFLADRTAILNHCNSYVGGAPVVFWDAWGATVGGDGYGVAARLSDDRHPNSLGVEYMALGANLLANDNTSRIWCMSQIVEPGNVYDIFKAGYANRFSAALATFQGGNTGTFGAGCSGTIADGWRVERTGDAVVTVEMIDNSSVLGAGARKVRITATPGTAAGAVKLVPITTTQTPGTAVAANKWVRGGFRVKPISGMTCQPTTTVSRTPFGDGTYFAAVLSAVGSGISAMLGRTLKILTPVFQLDSAATGFYLPALSQPYGASGAQFVFEVEEAMMWLDVADPRPKFGKASAPSTGAS